MGHNQEVIQGLLQLDYCDRQTLQSIDCSLSNLVEEVRKANKLKAIEILTAQGAIGANEAIVRVEEMGLRE